MVVLRVLKGALWLSLFIDGSIALDVWWTSMTLRDVANIVLAAVLLGLSSSGPSRADEYRDYAALECNAPQGTAYVYGFWSNGVDDDANSHELGAIPREGVRCDVGQGWSVLLFGEEYILHPANSGFRIQINRRPLQLNEQTGDPGFYPIDQQNIFRMQTTDGATLEVRYCSSKLHDASADEVSCQDYAITGGGERLEKAGKPRVCPVSKAPDC